MNLKWKSVRKKQEDEEAVLNFLAQYEIYSRYLKKLWKSCQKLFLLVYTSDPSLGIFGSGGGFGRRISRLGKALK